MITAKNVVLLGLGLGLGLGVGACAGHDPHVALTEEWPAQTGDYEDVTASWTRQGILHGAYQEVLKLGATLKSTEWRAAHVAREAEVRHLNPEGIASLVAQSQADAAGPYELELLVTTWDRRENDIHRGKRSVWRVVLIDDAGKEIEPLEIVRDRRPPNVIRAEFPALGEFAEPYIARFPHTAQLLGPGVHQLRLRMTSERGGVELTWI